MTEESNVVAVCAQCLSDFDPGQGRGRKSVFCADCRRERAKIRAAARSFSVMSAQMVEVSLLFGAELTRKRVEVTGSQEGRCSMCGRKRKLLLRKTVDGEPLVGLCIECFTKEVHGGDQEDAQGARRRSGGSERA